MQALSENFVCSVAMEGFFEKYKTKLLDKSHLSPNGQCLLWSGTTKKSGYGVINFKCPLSGKWKSMNVHRFTFMIFSATLDIGTMDISHLCHNTLCIQSCHLSMEPHTVNCDRVRCVIGACARVMRGIQIVCWSVKCKLAHSKSK